MNRPPSPDEHGPESEPSGEGAARPRDIDQEIRINELNEQARELGLTSFEKAPDIPPDIEEAFLASMIEYETAPISCPFEALETEGVQLPPAEDLGEIELNRKLWQVINTLAERNTFVTHTDHLSDRELYDHLWTDSLREMGPVLVKPVKRIGKRPKNPGWVQFIDPIGSGSEADTLIWLRYYAKQEDRDRWADQFPDDPMPPQEKPKYDRDRLLPKAPFPFGPRAEGDESEVGSEADETDPSDGTDPAIDPYKIDDSDE
ncbi:MAG: hypothetical protein J0L78_05545 [Planctomycetes bacterium]|nr:hypothetical protein [Planctomycetota bacterium]